VPMPPVPFVEVHRVSRGKALHDQSREGRILPQRREGAKVGRGLLVFLGALAGDSPISCVSCLSWSASFRGSCKGEIPEVEAVGKLVPFAGT